MSQQANNQSSTDAHHEQIETFYLALVQEDVYNDCPLCPHCDSHEQPLKLKEYDDDHIWGELMLCNECVQPYLIVTMPVFASTEVIYTRFRLAQPVPMLP